MEPGFLSGTSGVALCWPGAPDVAVEVVSPSDAYVDVHDKAADLLRHGTAMVVVVEPDRRRLVVHRSEKDVTILTERSTPTDVRLARFATCPTSV